MTSPTHWSDPPLDELLIKRLRNGDSDAQEQVYRRYNHCVFTLALRMTQSRSDAMDCTQDSFIKVFEQSHQFLGQSPFWAWVRRIALNTTLDRLRLLHRDRQRHDSSSHQGADQPLDSVPSLELSESRQSELLLAYQTLGATARAVIWMHDVEGISHQDIAEQFKRSVSFSKTTLLRARRRMREHLEARLMQDGQSLQELMTEH